MTNRIVPLNHSARSNLLGTLAEWRGAVYYYGEHRLTKATHKFNARVLAVALKRVAVLFKKVLRWLTTPLFIISFLTFLLWPEPAKTIYGQPLSPAPPIHKVVMASALPASPLEPVATVDAVYVPPAPKPAPVAPPSVGYSGTGDYYLDWIIAHESGGNPYAVNPIGACGLGQSLPCSKVLNACGSLSNVSCQIEWVRSYCISAYGSTYNAFLFWQVHSWY